MTIEPWRKAMWAARRILLRGMSDDEKMHFAVANGGDCFICRDGVLFKHCRQPGRDGGWPLLNRVHHPLFEHVGEMRVK